MRSDDDTWDITTSVGATALFVAAARALEAQKPDPVAVDGYAEVFCRAAGGPWAEVLDNPVSDNPLRTTDFGIHFVNFQGARTRYFDDFFKRASAAGVRQVVILAAGLDSRAYRLRWPDATVIYELDLPRVLEFKREVLAAHGDVARAERREVAADLRDDWPAALRAAGFDPAVPAAIIAEGLLIYLPAAAQEKLFRDIDVVAAPGSFVGLEEGEPMPTEVWEAAKAAERAAAGPSAGVGFFHLIYNEQCAPGAAWYGGRDWSTEATRLSQLLTTLRRPLPPEGSQARGMVEMNTLVSGVKQAQ